ncbi:thioredoxin domain-containing protein [Pseudoflavitalea sp. G-6-1-2]|uniref:thioredoxin domain-containing protein n=1 Tax=Pseudoflavitalea sp. G-6-1-2 TaxID=2728841 RepID=UPI00146DC208|nr:thioredoxin domain-containing protein [Pseudoflavitalea sp. G-6-1-2]NML19498.1 thioredoxin domain-containing protein [Pseudoflavitalea sp. G-6-1-2]
MAKYTNRLANETSPYLLQHAHNPVDWYPWGPEALEKAKAENKPILVSIGYAACHWCHVMEHESFEDEATAAIMNEHFVNIKIDREERPDLDHIYMDAVQAMTGSGGWPLNVFLTPDTKPFYGGTYYPPKPVHNRPSWHDVLHGVANAFVNKRADIEAQAEQLTTHLISSNGFGLTKPAVGIISESLFTKEKSDEMFANIMKQADMEEGGFGQAPKFPQTFTIRFLLQYHKHTGNEAALKQACLSLDKMIYGGIYDQIGGGFARYSTDAEWLAPHFEKMLYDNALLVIALCDAWQLTGNLLYKRTIEQTLAFVERELTAPQEGFYAALDADSEGVEGKYYVWSKEEIKALLGADAEIYCEFYDVTEEGNWEHTNILRVIQHPADFAASKGISTEALWAKLDACSQTLLQHRETRIRPALDDKQLLGWNALMNTAYSKAYAALGMEHYRQVAVKNMEFLLQSFRAENDNLHHTYKAGVARYPAFLDDYACLIEALIQLQEITGEKRWLTEAKQLTQTVLDKFSEDETGFFFYTPSGQADIIVRKKEVYDGAVPSGNAVMAINLYYLGMIFDEGAWKERAATMCAALMQAVVRYPTSFGVWATMIQALSYGIPEIAIVGGEFATVREDFLKTYLPFRIFQSSPKADEQFPLLSGKSGYPETMIFLCKDYTCRTPVTQVDALLQQLQSV